MPPGYIFAMGDNRDDSADSRYWGLVPRENIVGTPVIIYWSFEAATADLTNPNIGIDHIIDVVTQLLHEDAVEADVQADPRLSAAVVNPRTHTPGPLRKAEPGEHMANRIRISNWNAAALAGRVALGVLGSRLLPPVIAQASGTARAKIGRDPFRKLENDHRMIEATLQDMAAATEESAAQRMKLFLLFKRKLGKHALAEEDAVYPVRLRDRRGRGEGARALRRARPNEDPVVRTGVGADLAFPMARPRPAALRYHPAAHPGRGGRRIPAAAQNAAGKGTRLVSWKDPARAGNGVVIAA